MAISINTFLADFVVFPVGFILGLLYFSCLWFTVQRMATSRHPILLIVGSGLARISLALLGFYLLIDGHWERLLIAIVGFLMARTLLVARWRPQAALGDWSEED